MYDTCYYIYEVVIKLHFIINKITIVENDNCDSMSYTFENFSFTLDFQLFSLAIL